MDLRQNSRVAGECWLGEEAGEYPGGGGKGAGGDSR
jgi:hypothetical protein